VQDRGRHRHPRGGQGEAERRAAADPGNYRAFAMRGQRGHLGRQVTGAGPLGTGHLEAVQQRDDMPPDSAGGGGAVDQHHP
jgi:hypothetical protein